MNLQPILLILSLVFLLMASFTSFGRVNIGWLGVAFFVASFLVR